MPEQQQPPMIVMQSEQKKSKGGPIVSIILILVLIVLGFYGYSWATSDVGRQKLSAFSSSISTQYNPFYWYGEQLKGAKEIGTVWETKSNATAEKVGIKFQAFETIGGKIVPSGTPLALRYKFDVGEGVNEIPVNLECTIQDKDNKQAPEEDIIEPGSKTYVPSKNPKISTDNPLSYSDILCQMNTKKVSKDKLIAAEGKVSFPFKQQRGSLKVYFSKDIVNIGKKFFDKEGLKESLPIKSAYSNEPVELGLGIGKENIQPVVVWENRPSAAGISLKNRWDGRVTKVTEMNLVLPKAVKINKENSPQSLLCPFGEPTSVGTNYVRYTAGKTYLEQIHAFGKGVTETLETAQSFFCWLEVDEGVLEGKPYNDKEYTVDVSYEYEFQPRSETITLKGVTGGEQTETKPGTTEEKPTEEKKYLCITGTAESRTYNCVTKCTQSCKECESYDTQTDCEKIKQLYQSQVQ